MPHTEEWRKLIDAYWDGLTKNTRFYKDNLVELVEKIHTEALEQGRKEGREGALREVIEIVPKEIEVSESTFHLSEFEAFLWHENNGRNSFRRIFLAALSKLRKV